MSLKQAGGTFQQRFRSWCFVNLLDVNLGQSNHAYIDSGYWSPQIVVIVINIFIQLTCIQAILLQSVSIVSKNYHSLCRFPGFLSASEIIIFFYVLLCRSLLYHNFCHEVTVIFILRLSIGIGLLILFLLKLLFLKLGWEEASIKIGIGRLVIHKEINQVLFIYRCEILELDFVFRMIHQLQNSLFKLSLLITLHVSSCYLNISGQILWVIFREIALFKTPHLPISIIILHLLFNPPAHYAFLNFFDRLRQHLHQVIPHHYFIDRLLPILLRLRALLKCWWLVLSYVQVTQFLCIISLYGLEIV